MHTLLQVIKQPFLTHIMNTSSVNFIIILLLIMHIPPTMYTVGVTG